MNKNRRSTILFISALTFTCCHGQNSNDDRNVYPATGNPDSTEAQIVLIRKEYNMIHANEPKFKVVTEDMDDRSTEGGEIKKYYQGKSLRKARLIFYGETGKTVFEYYFVDGMVIFFLKKIYDYNIPMYMKGSRVSKIEEERFYFNNRKLIRWISSDGKIIAANLYSGKEDEILKDLNETVYKK
jgi:hypothetical protein